MGEPEVEAFLTHLAVHRRVAESTQNQALARPKRLPTVLSRKELRRLLAGMVFLDSLVVELRSLIERGLEVLDLLSEPV
jgi:hypothetical protein